jgi:pyruvate dehydrogenase E2 component (dihydrolipoamide acetyltransferase)
VTEFTLPELGENVTEGDVVRVLVRVGDTVQREQALLELETDKATIEVPSSVSGVVKELRVKPGDKVKVGQAVLVVDDEGAAAPPPEPDEPGTDVASARAEAPVAEAAATEGGLATDAQVKEGSADAPDQRGQQEREQGLGQVQEDFEPQPGRDRRVVDIAQGRQGAAAAPAAAAAASPSTRRYARELGIDISHVPGSGPGGRVSVDDVKGHARTTMTSGGSRAAAYTSRALPDFSRWGQVERESMRAIRRKTAEHMASAWATIPHVTQFDKADVTELEHVRQKYARRVEAAGGKLTLTVIALKVAASALKAFPQFNASIDLDREEIIYKKYTHIGVAVDTEAGLLVPVIRDVDRKNIVQLSRELAEVAEKAKARKLSLAEMEGGCFTISNLGGIGGTYFTPIVNAPEVAILGISRSVTEPVFADGEFEPRLMMPLSLSYDHRLIDGADAIRFLRWVCEALEQPFMMSLEG